MKRFQFLKFTFSIPKSVDLFQITNYNSSRNQNSEQSTQEKGPGIYKDNTGSCPLVVGEGEVKEVTMSKGICLFLFGVLSLTAISTPAFAAAEGFLACPEWYKRKEMPVYSRRDILSEPKFSLKCGSNVRILKEKHGWFKIKAKKKGKGYIHSQFILALEKKPKAKNKTASQVNRGQEPADAIFTRDDNAAGFRVAGVKGKVYPFAKIPLDKISHGQRDLNLDQGVYLVRFVESGEPRPIDYRISGDTIVAELIGGSTYVIFEKSIGVLRNSYGLLYRLRAYQDEIVRLDPDLPKDICQAILCAPERIRASDLFTRFPRLEPLRDEIHLGDEWVGGWNRPAGQPPAVDICEICTRPWALTVIHPDPLWWTPDDIVILDATTSCIEDFCAFGGDCVKCLDSCGNGVCNAHQREDCSTCASDCGECLNQCGDGRCSVLETSCTCAQDCEADLGTCSLVSTTCGNALVDALETCANCASDVGACDLTVSCPSGGNGSCDVGEDCTNCAADCGPCRLEDPPVLNLTCPSP